MGRHPLPAYGLASGVLLASGCLLPSVTRCASPDLDQGARLAGSCAACHRRDGQDKGIPTIVGMGAPEIVRKMRAFRSDEDNHVMHGVSLSLSDEEISAVARYLAAARNESKQP